MTPKPYCWRQVADLTREGLNLEAVGVEVDARGAIIVDEYLKTINPNIRAVGDVKGGLQFTYISLDDYRIVREDLFGDKERKANDRNPVSYSVFIDPPLARIGLNEEEASQAELGYYCEEAARYGYTESENIGGDGRITESYH